MARKLRIYVPSMPLHVIMRGNDRKPIFRRDADRYFMRRCLGDAFLEYDVALHAYVFMTNHIHMLLTPSGPDALARALQSVGPRYVGYFNRSYVRTGTLWEGRHKQILVQTETYALACMRYIELNPVRARMVAGPEGFYWSSHRFHALGQVDPLVTPHAVFTALSEVEARRRSAYLGLFDEEADARYTAEFRAVARCGYVIGDPDFMDFWGRQLKAGVGKAGGGVDSDPNSDPNSDP